MAAGRFHLRDVRRITCGVWATAECDAMLSHGCWHQSRGQTRVTTPALPSRLPETLCSQRALRKALRGPREPRPGESPATPASSQLPDHAAAQGLAPATAAANALRGSSAITKVSKMPSAAPRCADRWSAGHASLRPVAAGGVDTAALLRCVRPSRYSSSSSVFWRGFFRSVACGIPRKFMKTLNVTVSPCLKPALWFRCKKTSLSGNLFLRSVHLMKP
mmetsp:Transcript_81289/g.263285  ORF Transcript_81289/g.263285 Transcript_81289/m.263285 type:complete len:219 (+) Transcript_81289:92-748(+)